MVSSFEWASLRGRFHRVFQRTLRLRHPYDAAGDVPPLVEPFKFVVVARDERVWTRGFLWLHDRVNATRRSNPPRIGATDDDVTKEVNAPAEELKQPFVVSLELLVSTHDSPLAFECPGRGKESKETL